LGTVSTLSDKSLINGITLKPSISSTRDSDDSLSHDFNDCKKWRLVVSYDGIRYAGWQFQEYPPTIQCLLEKALIRATKLDRKCLQLVGASRTDAGVHALGQVAHFLTPFNYDTLDRIHAEALNGLLPDDIRVREIAPVVPEFHARFSVTSKLYRYRIYNSPVMDPLLRHHAYHCPYNLNAAIMAEAAKHFVGRHDFLAFANTSRNDRVPHPVKTIIRFDGSVIQLDVEGTGFLYRQVRNMVALLIQIGKEGVPTDMVGMILESRDRRKLAKYTSMSAPSQGLCLVSVNYNQDHLCLPELGYPSVSFGRHQTISKCKLPPYLV
ncbi:tRNA pseudouridine synthase A 1, partial [Linum perenne]